MKYLLQLFFLLFLSSVAVGQADRSEQYYYKAVRALVEEQDMNQAIIWLNKSIDTDSSYFPSYLLRNRLYLYSRNIYEAGREMRDFELLDPEYVKKYLKDYALYDALAFPKGEVVDYDYSLVENPQDYQNYRNRGLVNNHIQTLLDQRADLDVMIKQDPSAMAYVRRGLSRFYGGDLQGAMDDYEEAVRQNPGLAVAHNFLGIAQMEAGQIALAINNFTDAVEIKSDFAAAYFNRGLAYFDEGKDDEAFEDLSKSIEINEQYPVAFQDRGSVLFAMQKYPQAADDFTKVLEKEPDNKDASLNRALAYSFAGEYPQALVDYDSLLARYPNDPVVFNHRGVLYLLMEENEKAMEDFQQAIDLDERYGVAYYNRALVYMYFGEREKTCSDLWRSRRLGVGEAVERIRWFCNQEPPESSKMNFPSDIYSPELPVEYEER